MKRFFLSLLAIFFPWIVVLMDGKPVGAFLNLALQLTFIGWIPATIWGFKAVNRLCLPEKELNSSENLDKTQEEDVATPPVEENPEVIDTKSIHSSEDKSQSIPEKKESVQEDASSKEAPQEKIKTAKPAVPPKENQ
ncbi:MAG: YqaE/Pmp3 family membrane protein [Legionellaceae bacterium]|nr:YqaE/Pmp3 family membrane protein [Legionellaceae bacterium]